MKFKYLTFGILILLIISSLIYWFNYIPLKQNLTSEKGTPIFDIIENYTYHFEPKWWLKPQTFGMFNYYAQTNYTRLNATNCTVNGYRLVYDLNDFDYKKDIENAHKKGIKYVVGMLFKITNLNQTCIPYETIKMDSLQKAKKIIDFGVDGLAIIHPFGDHHFIDTGISCLCPENSNLSLKHQLNCAVKFFEEFTKEIKAYKDNFPIAIASHGEWLIPFTVNMLSFSDFDYINIDNINDFPHNYDYKLYFAATNAPLIASPSDVSFGWLEENSKKPEDLIQILMAEAYSQKGAFQDQYLAGLSPKCKNHTSFAESCWLGKSINASAVKRINSFYLANQDLFNSQSLAKIGVLFSPKSVTSKESKHWVVFQKISKILTLGHYQYDVLFSGNSNEITLKKLKQYRVIIFPENGEIDRKIIPVIQEYLNLGGKIMIIGTVDLKMTNPNGTSYVVLNENLDLWENPGMRFKEFKDLINKNRFFEILDGLSGRSISENTLPENVGIQVWQNNNKTIIHLVNYDFDLNKGVVEKKNLSVFINLKKIPKTVTLLSPNLKQNIIFNLNNDNIHFIVPKLKIWDILVME